MPHESGAAIDHGLSFRFHLLPDFRGDSHWTYLQLDAHHPSQEEEMGYLRVAFIPKATAEAMNRERLLLVQSKGHTVYPRPAKRGEDRTLFSDFATHDGWKAQPKNAARYVMENVIRYGWSQWNQQMKELTPEQMVELVETHRPELNAFTQPGIEKMFDFGVNKADVDYVSLDDHWQGRGLAIAMYQGMARYLDEHYGITLNASTTQTPSAQACWERMKAQGLVKASDDGRLFFTHGVSQKTLEGRDVTPEPQPQPVPRQARRARLG